MCGRFTLDLDQNEVELYLKTHYQIENPNIDLLLPRYNIAPSTQILTVINDGLQYRAGPLRWGLVPPFAKDEKIGNKMINARSETLSEKASFKHAFKRKRCIILTSGFYEWKKTEDGKIPYFIYLKNQPIFSFAGLWSQYKKDDGTSLFTCTIITTESNNIMHDIHHRMPVILTQETEKVWLNKEIEDTTFLQTLLTPFPDHEMAMHPVSSDVNYVRNDGNHLIKPLNSL